MVSLFFSPTVHPKFPPFSPPCTRNSFLSRPMSSDFPDRRDVSILAGWFSRFLSRPPYEVSPSPSVNRKHDNTPNENHSNLASLDGIAARQHSLPPRFCPPGLKSFTPSFTRGDTYFSTIAPISDRETPLLFYTFTCCPFFFYVGTILSLDGSEQATGYLWSRLHRPPP